MSTHPAILKVTSKERHQKEDYKVIPQGKMSVSIKERLKYDFRQRWKTTTKWNFSSLSCGLNRFTVQSVFILGQNSIYFFDFIFFFRKYMFLHCINYSFLIYFFLQFNFFQPCWKLHQMVNLFSLQKHRKWWHGNSNHFQSRK